MGQTSTGVPATTGFQAKPLLNDVVAALKELRLEKTRTKSGKALLNAIALGNTSKAKAALDAGADVNDTDADGNTPLHLAVKDGEAEIVQLLAKYKPTLETINKHGLTALALAACEGHVDIVEKLAEAGANVNSTTPVQHETPLMMAAYRGAAAMTESLVRHGAKVNLQDSNGVTAFMRASGENHADCLGVLAKGGADPDVTSNTGRTAYEYAQRVKAKEAMCFIDAYVVERAAKAVA